MHRLWVVAGLVCALGCGGEGAACLENEQTACACAGGASGVQVCNAEGAGYSACQCPCAGTMSSGVCTCPEGYTGAQCRECAPGFQDNDRNGTCQASCKSLSCGPHQTCSDAVGAAACTCVSGYVASVTGDCSFFGLVKDVSFAERSAAWSSAGGGAVDAAGAGHDGPGLAVLSGTASCDARVSQTLQMPSFASSGPMRLRFDTKVYCDGSCSRVRRPDVRLGGFTTRPLDASFNWTTRTFCLGERAYGGPKELQLGHEVEATCRPYVYGTAFDNVQLIPDVTCPAPGELLNGDFEGLNGWELSEATLAAGEGTQGSRALLLAMPTVCSSPHATGLVSVPATGRSALEFKVSGNADETLEVRLGSWPMANLQAGGTASFSTVRLCFPEIMKGTVQELYFAGRAPGGYCLTPYERKLAVDDVRVVEDPTCEANAALLNGGFERTDPAVGWALVSHPVNGSPGGYARITRTNYYGGGRALQLGLTNECGSVFASTLITVPAARGAEGPALRYRYASGGADHPFNGYNTNVADTLLPFANTWTRRIECFPPRLANQPFELRFQGGFGGGCGMTMDEQLFVDDVELTTDAACPAQ